LLSFAQPFLAKLKLTINWSFSPQGLTSTGKVTNKLVIFIWLKMAERNEAKTAKRSFASKINKEDILTRSFASRF